jgi:signal transduction histidine kinase
MKEFIKKLPIKVKMMLIIMVTCFMSLLLAGAAVILYDGHHAKQDMVKDISSIGKLIADRSTAALTFQDYRLAKENLSALHVKSSVRSARIFNEQGVVFAEYGAFNGETPACQGSGKSDGYRFENGRLSLFEPIILEKKRIGTVYICAGLEEFFSHRRYFILLMTAIILTSSCIAFILSSRLQTFISGPLLQLAETAQRIARQKDYSLRAAKSSDDEIGTLIAAFNDMLEMIDTQNAELERRVAKRTAELVVAKDRAESADRVKSAFLATMSHELRTPLNSIIGFTGLVLQGLAGPLNKEQTKQLLMVQNSGQHLLSLINDVLDISKIEASQIEIANSSFDFSGSIQKVIQTVKPIADKKNLLLTPQVASDVGQILGDCRRVEQILLNLLSNAVKFTESGEVRVECRLDQGFVVTRVVDTGPGIRSMDLDKLFQPFRQLDTGLTRQHEGTGLGLAICKRLTELMGGAIAVESEWGKGSKFEFRLPVHQEQKS